MKNQELESNLYLKYDKLFNKTLLNIEELKEFLLNNEPLNEREEHLFYMLEKELNELKDTIEILKDKRIEDYYKNN